MTEGVQSVFTRINASKITRFFRGYIHISQQNLLLFLGCVVNQLASLDTNCYHSHLAFISHSSGNHQVSSVQAVIRQLSGSYQASCLAVAEVIMIEQPCRLEGFSVSFYLLVEEFAENKP